MVDALPRALHVVGAVAWLGPQLMMFIAVVPALRAIDDSARSRAMAVLTVRLNYLAWGALALLLLTGLYTVGDRVADFNLFVVKSAFALAIIGLTAWHSFVVGPRLRALQEEAAATGGSDAAVMRGLRRQTVMVSALNLLLGLAIVYMGVLLRQTEFSFT
jgi:uncharacterized membrane protein